MAPFLMPSLGADMDRGTVVEWRVAAGDEVHRGDIVAVVETEKSTIEVEVFEDGVVEELLVAPGVEVEVGTPLASISAAARPGRGRRRRAAATAPSAPAPTPEGAEGEGGARAAAAAAAPTAPGAPGHHPVTSPIVRHLAERLGVDTDAVTGSGPGARITRADVEAAAGTAAGTAAVPPAGTPPPPTRPTPPRPATGGRVPASPRARRLAQEVGVDLASLHGTGPGGAVLARDVPSPPAGTAPTPAPPPAPTATAPVAATEGLPAARPDPVGALMARSKQEVPHYYLRTTIDLATVTERLEELNRDRPPAERVVPAAVLLWATARAAARHPRLNGHWVDGGFRPADGVRLGVAVNLRDGSLLAPALADADRLTVDQLMARLRDLTQRAKAGRLRASEMATPSITVTNLGDGGVEEVFGVIYPPQVALVGFGRIVERPWAVDGMLAVRPVVVATLSADHRATNGHEGARFLATLDRLLRDREAPWNDDGPKR